MFSWCFLCTCASPWSDDRRWTLPLCPSSSKYSTMRIPELHKMVQKSGIAPIPPHGLMMGVISNLPLRPNTRPIWYPVHHYYLLWHTEGTHQCCPGLVFHPVYPGTSPPKARPIINRDLPDTWFFCIPYPTSQLPTSVSGLVGYQVGYLSRIWHYIWLNSWSVICPDIWPDIRKIHGLMLTRYLARY